MAEHPHLYRDDLQLLAGLLADHLLASAAGAGRFVLGQLTSTRGSGLRLPRRLTGATTSSASASASASLGGRRCDQLFGLVEHGQLRRVGIFRAALGFGREQFVPQQGDLLLELRHLSMRQQQHLLEQDGIVGKVVGARFHGAGLYRLRPRSAASVPGAGGYATDQCRRAASSTHLHPEADSSVEGGDYGALTFQDRWWLESPEKYMTTLGHSWGAKNSAIIYLII